MKIEINYEQLLKISENKPQKFFYECPEIFIDISFFKYIMLKMKGIL
jgi:hypothetical protein